MEKFVVKENLHILLLLRAAQIQGCQNTFMDFESVKKAKQAKKSLENLGYEVWYYTLGKYTAPTKPTKSLEVQW